MGNYQIDNVAKIENLFSLSLKNEINRRFGNNAVHDIATKLYKSDIARKNLQAMLDAHNGSPRGIIDNVDSAYNPEIKNAAGAGYNAGMAYIRLDTNSSKENS